MVQAALVGVERFEYTRTHKVFQIIRGWCRLSMSSILAAMLALNDPTGSTKPVLAQGPRLRGMEIPQIRIDSSTQPTPSLLQVPRSMKSWNAGDRRAAAVMLGGIAADCATTVAALNRGAVEKNPFLGSRPGTLNTVIGCALGAGVTTAVADVLPHKWRRRVLNGIGLVGMLNALHNTRQGSR